MGGPTESVSDPVSERKVESNQAYLRTCIHTHICLHTLEHVHAYIPRAYTNKQNANCLTHELMLAGAPAKTDVGACFPPSVLTFGYLHSPKACVLGAWSQPVVRLGGDRTLRK